MFTELTVEDCQSVIRARNPALRAVLHVLPVPQRSPEAPADAPLSNVPYVLKDSWDTAGIRTTGGSWRHRDRVPSESVAIHRALAKAGAILLGKSNLPDLALSNESANHIVGATRNPHDPTRTSGGSTGGGAAAVATGMAAFDWGSDFGGSIRCPAAACGVAGIRLSEEAWPGSNDHFPRISPFFRSFQGYGPVARTVAQCRALTRLMSHLRRDIGSTNSKSDRAVLYIPDTACRGIWRSFEGDAALALSHEGVAFDVDRSIPPPSAVNNLFNGYLCAHFDEFSTTGELSVDEGTRAVALALATLGKLDRRVHPNTAVLIALMQVGRWTVYRSPRAMDEGLTALRAAVRDVWDSGRLIVAPMATIPPPRHGRAVLHWYWQAYSKLGNMTDATCIAVPFGRFDNGLPRSIQVLGPAGSEEAVFDLAEKLERAGKA